MNHITYAPTHPINLKNGPQVVVKDVSWPFIQISSSINTLQQAIVPMFKSLLKHWPLCWAAFTLDRASVSNWYSSLYPLRLMYNFIWIHTILGCVIIMCCCSLIMSWHQPYKHTYKWFVISYVRWRDKTMRINRGTCEDHAFRCIQCSLTKLCRSPKACLKQE